MQLEVVVESWPDDVCIVRIDLHEVTALGNDDHAVRVLTPGLRYRRRVELCKCVILVLLTHFGADLDALHREVEIQVLRYSLVQTLNEIVLSVPDEDEADGCDDQDLLLSDTIMDHERVVGLGVHRKNHALVNVDLLAELDDVDAHIALGVFLTEDVDLLQCSLFSQVHLCEAAD